MSDKAKAPSGVVAILTAPDGFVIASAVDCDEQTPGGFTVEASQTRRARDSLASAAVRRLCTGDVADVLSSYDVDKLLQSLVREKGYRITTLPIGG